MRERYASVIITPPFAAVPTLDVRFGDPGFVLVDHDASKGFFDPHDMLEVLVGSYPDARVEASWAFGSGALEKLYSSIPDMLSEECYERAKEYVRMGRRMDHDAHEEIVSETREELLETLLSGALHAIAYQPLEQYGRIWNVRFDTGVFVSHEMDSVIGPEDHIVVEHRFDVLDYAEEYHDDAVAFQHYVLSPDPSYGPIPVMFGQLTE